MKGLLAKAAICILFLLLLGLIGSTAANVNVRKNCLAHFASASEAAEILTRKDDFVQRLSDFDRAARMKTDKSVSEEEFLRFVKASVSSWTDAERAKVEAAIWANSADPRDAIAVFAKNYFSRQEHWR